MIYVECWNINVFNRIKYVRRAGVGERHVVGRIDHAMRFSQRYELGELPDLTSLPYAAYLLALSEAHRASGPALA